MNAMQQLTATIDANTAAVGRMTAAVEALTALVQEMRLELALVSTAVS
jgi:hypothetical protein